MGAQANLGHGGGAGRAEAGRGRVVGLQSPDYQPRRLEEGTPSTRFFGGQPRRLRLLSTFNPPTGTAAMHTTGLALV
jgi:hypothetical protein